jgi:hypothetical protein
LFWYVGLCVVSGTYAQRARRRGRVASRASRSLLAVRALSGLLLIASIAPGAARAGTAVAFGRPHGSAAAILPPGAASAPGGATMASATPLGNQPSYRGTIAPGGQLWYKFEHTDGERMHVNLWGKTPACPVRATMLDADGHELGEIISSTHEIEPFIVYFPPHEVSLVYYLRIDTGPAASAPCAGAGYVFTLQEPEQPQCQASLLPDGEQAASCVLAEKSAPAYEASVCSQASRRYRQLANDLANERGHVGVGTRRRLESEVYAARREVTHGCHH